jgi:transcription initiation factor TFIIIB Brf1 subunit/transcription initiation factor TFIIB
MSKCQHPESVISTDYETGDYFCGDCGVVVNAWANQTALQRGRYERTWGHLPPAEQEAGNG